MFNRDFYPTPDNVIADMLTPKVWEMFNRRVSEIKGYPLPEKVGLI